MSLYDYRMAVQLAIQDPPFDALIMAAMRKADSHNTRLLRDAWPELWAEMKARYNSPGGRLLGERGSICPGFGNDDRCKGVCTKSADGEILDPDCFR